MKTTVELPDDLLEEAKHCARTEGTTLRQLLIQGLRTILAERARTKDYRLIDKSFEGRGVCPEVREGTWDVPFDRGYEGRGS